MDRPQNNDEACVPQAGSCALLRLVTAFLLHLVKVGIPAAVLSVADIFSTHFSMTKSFGARLIVDRERRESQAMRLVVFYVLIKQVLSDEGGNDFPVDAALFHEIGMDLSHSGAGIREDKRLWRTGWATLRLLEHLHCSPQRQMSIAFLEGHIFAKLQEINTFSISFR